MIKGGLLISTVLLLIASAASVSCAYQEARHVAVLRARMDADNPKNSWSADEGYQRLIAEKRFALGGVGAAGATSDGEFALRAILRSPDSAKLFEQAFSQATPEGQLHALCGLRATDRKKFKNISASLMDDTRPVTTILGCMMFEEPMRRAVQRIIAGSYDFCFVKY